jgi:hypothetical protein
MSFLLRVNTDSRARKKNARSSGFFLMQSRIPAPTKLLFSARLIFLCILIVCAPVGEILKRLLWSWTSAAVWHRRICTFYKSTRCPETESALNGRQGEKIGAHHWVRIISIARQAAFNSALSGFARATPLFRLFLMPVHLRNQRWAEYQIRPRLAFRFIGMPTSGLEKI